MTQTILLLSDMWRSIRFVTGKTILMLFLACSLSSTSLALMPDEVLDDPMLEAKARAISAQLRCLVCQNESIDESNADMARDLRILVRERLLAGDNEEEVIQYLVDRFGEFIRLQPVFHWHTILLWGAAPLILLIGFFILISRFGQSRTNEVGALSESEKKQIDDLLS